MPTKLKSMNNRSHIAEITAPKQRRGVPFRPGKSGNPAGRPRGSRNKTTLAAQALLDNEAEAITRKAVELALKGDSAVLRLVMERLVPIRKDSPVELALPKVETAADCCKAVSAIISAVSAGKITPSQGLELSNLFERFRQIYEASELEMRIRDLEEKYNEIRSQD